MTYPVLAGAVVLTTANRRLRFREAAGAVGNVDLDAGTYYLRGGYTTNLLARSEELGDATWLKSQASVIDNAITAPDGTLSADKIIASTANAQHFVYQTATTSGTNTFSCYVKAAGENWIRLQAVDSGSAYFDVKNGKVGNTIGATASIYDAGNGWFRCVVVSTAYAGPTNYILTANANGATNYVGDGISGVYVWGVQLEAGSSVGLYVRTTTASASGPTDELTYQIKTKLDAFGAGGNTYDVTMSRNIDPGLPHSQMTITRSAGTSTFGLVVDGSQTFDMSLIGFSASTLNDANAKTSPVACAANWVGNDIPREIESFSERVVAVPRAVSGRVQGVTRSSRMQSWRLGLAFVDRRRMLIEEALDGAQDTLEGFLERFGATASIEMWLAPILSGTTLQGLQSSTLVDVVQASEETLSRFEPQRLGPGVPLYSIDLRLHAKV